MSKKYIKCPMCSEGKVYCLAEAQILYYLHEQGTEKSITTLSGRLAYGCTHCDEEFEREDMKVLPRDLELRP